MINMFAWIDPIMDEARTRAEIMISESVGVQYVPADTESSNEPTHLHYPFKLPISYLPNNELHILTNTVTQDLELVNTVGEKSIYQRLFKPSHQFGEGLIQDWKQYFTTNIFLQKLVTFYNGEK